MFAIWASASAGKGLNPTGFPPPSTAAARAFTTDSPFLSSMASAIVAGCLTRSRIVMRVVRYSIRRDSA